MDDKAATRDAEQAKIAEDKRDAADRSAGVVRSASGRPGIAPKSANDVPGFDVPDAEWTDYTVAGSAYEEQLDVSRIGGQWRHRKRVHGDSPHEPWREGRAPR